MFGVATHIVSIVAMAATVIPKAATARPSGAYDENASATWIAASTEYIDGGLWIMIFSDCKDQELSDAENIGCSHVYMFFVVCFNHTKCI